MMLLIIIRLNDSNGIRTHNHKIPKRTLNHLAKLEFTIIRLNITDIFIDLILTFLFAKFYKDLMNFIFIMGLLCPSKFLFQNELRGYL